MFHRPRSSCWPRSHSSSETNTWLSRRFRPALFAAALLVLLGPGVALAAPRTVAVMRFRGAGEEVAERAVVGAMPPGVRVIPRNLMDRALARLASDGNLRSQAEYAELAQLLRADAIVDGRVDIAGVEVALGLTVRRADGTDAASTSFRANSYKALVSKLERDGPPALARMLARVDDNTGFAGEPGAGFGDLQGEQMLGASAGGIGAGSDPPPYLEMAVGPRFMTRTLVFTDNLSGLPGYTMSGAAALLARVEYYPVARKNSAASRIGFAGEWERSVAAQTVADGGRDLAGTSIGSYRIGARYRMTRGSTYGTLGVDYGRHGFILNVDNVVSPNVEYAFLRPVIMASTAIAGRWSFALSVAYVHVLSVGGLGDDDMFPRLSANGADMRASLGFRINPSFGLEFAADLRHYAHRMNVRPGDAYVVGGAMDEHFGGAILGTYKMD